MSLGKRIGLVVVAILLISTIGAANVSHAVDRTVLDSGYVADTASEEGVFEAAADNVTDSIEGDLNNVDPAESGQLPSEVSIEGFDPGEIADEAVTEEYVENQSRQLLGSLYDFLHGNTDELQLVIDTEPVKENAAEAIEEQASTVDAAELISFGARNIESDRVPFEADRAASLLESPESFQSEKQRFRDNVREEVRQQTGASGEELDRQVEQALSEIETDTKSDIDATTPEATQEYSQTVTDATIDLQYALVEAYTTEMGYDEFISRVQTNEDRLAEEVGDLAIEQMDEEIDDEIALLEEMDPQDRQSLESDVDQAAGFVQTNDTAKTVLPLLALVLIGVAYGISRSLHTTGKVAGGSLLFGALIGFILSTALQSTLVDMLRGSVPEDGPNEATDAFIALVDGVLGTLSSQSLVLGLLGIVILALVFADEKGYLDDVKAKVSGEDSRADSVGAGSGGYQNQQQSYQQNDGQRGGQQDYQQGGQQNYQQGGQQDHQQGGQQNYQQGGQQDYQQGGQQNYQQGGQQDHQQGGQQDYQQDGTDDGSGEWTSGDDER